MTNEARITWCPLDCVVPDSTSDGRPIIAHAHGHDTIYEEAVLIAVPALRRIRLLEPATQLEIDIYETSPAGWIPRGQVRY